jgi:hypothetical protein
MGSGPVYPFEHFAYKQDVIDKLLACRAGRGPDFAALREVRLRILEAKPADPRRRLDGVIWDLGWHAFALLLLPLKLQGHAPRLEIQAVETAGHDGANGLTTAVRVRGTVAWAAGRVPFDVQVGKGLVDRKEWAFIGRDGTPTTASLAEGGFLAHHRQLHQMITQPPGEHFMNLHDAVRLVQLCHDAEALAQERPAYAVGELPAFLAEPALA